MSGTVLQRVHSEDYEAHHFNPRACATADEGGRFDAVYAGSYAYTHAGRDHHAAIAETLCRDLPEAGGARIVPVVMLRSRRLTQVRTVCDLQLLELHYPACTHVGAGLALTKRQAREYLTTRAWAEAPLSWLPDIDGFSQRFAHESESYVDLGHHMLERDKDGAYWMIADARHARRYFRTFTMDPALIQASKAAGTIVSGRSIEGLAARMQVNPARLRASVQRLNGFARSGLDGDFGRGNSAYDRYYSDPLVRPNPNLGPLQQAPFTAYRLVIVDLGTKGGVVTDRDGRALREDGSVIEGLYAAGNASASVTGHTYPGPGATLGPATVFGMRATRHMAGTRA